MEGSGYSIRHYERGDEDAITGLINRVFERIDASHEPVGNDWWQWKYLDNPAGYHSLVSEGPDGSIVAHYGGIPVRVTAEGVDYQFGQNCDTCSDPAVRRGLRNPGLFVRLGQAYASTFGHPDEDAVMYGLPSQEAFRLGARYLDYWMMRSQYLLVARRDVDFPTADEKQDGVVVEQVERFPDEVDALSDRLAADVHRCMVRRDARFLNWRFADPPATPYRMAIARDASADGTDTAVRGYAVVRPARFIGRDACVLVDWLVDPEDDAAVGDLLRFAMRECWQSRRRELFFLCPTRSVWFECFQAFGFAVEATHYNMTSRPYEAQLDPEYLREHWYYTLADFDIV